MKILLRKRLKQKLPGINAHLIMSPKMHNVPIRKFEPSPDARKSAVMVLLSYDSNKELQVLLTLRSHNLSSHSRQISFPGGMAEEGETLTETAYRETFEEIGIKSDSIELLGSLTTLYVPPSNFLIYPVVGWLHNKSDIKINPDEVAEIIYVKISKMRDRNSVKFQQKEFDGFLLDVPYWDVHPEVPLWGATAMILSELLRIFDEID